MAYSQKGETYMSQFWHLQIRLTVHTQNAFSLLPCKETANSLQKLSSSNQLLINYVLYVIMCLTQSDFSLVVIHNKYSQCRLCDVEEYSGNKSWTLLCYHWHFCRCAPSPIMSTNLKTKPTFSFFLSFWDCHCAFPCVKDKWFESIEWTLTCVETLIYAVFIKCNIKIMLQVNDLPKIKIKPQEPHLLFTFTCPHQVAIYFFASLLHMCVISWHYYAACACL